MAALIGTRAGGRLRGIGRLAQPELPAGIEAVVAIDQGKSVDAKVAKVKRKDAKETMEWDVGTRGYSEGAIFTTFTDS